MPTRTDAVWRRGDKKIWRVTVGGTDDMTSWSATLVWRRGAFGAVVISKSGTVDPLARTIDFAFASADTAAITDNALDWTCWRTDTAAADAELGYGTVTLYGGPRS